MSVRKRVSAFRTPASPLPKRNVREATFARARRIWRRPHRVRVAHPVRAECRAPYRALAHAADTKLVADKDLDTLDTLIDVLLQLALQISRGRTGVNYREDDQALVVTLARKFFHNGWCRQHHPRLALIAGLKEDRVCVLDSDLWAASKVAPLSIFFRMPPRF